MIYSSTIALGFFRLCLLVLVLFYLNRKFINYHKQENIFDFIANQWFKYGSLLTILIFILVQLSIYNLFNVILIFFVFIFIDYVGLRLIKKSLAFSGSATFSGFKRTSGRSVIAFRTSWCSFFSLKRTRFTSWCTAFSSWSV